MAPTSGPRPGRLLAVAFVTLIGLYAIALGTGNLTPQLGLDLRGGTEVVLKPENTLGNKGKITQTNLNTAVDIIRQRVNGIGVAEADVRVEGTNIVIDVPGKGRNEVVKLVGSTALLRFRQVLAVGSGAPVTPTTPSPGATPTPSASTTPQPSVHSPAPTPTQGTHGRSVSDALVAKSPAKKTKGRATPTATPSPSPTSTPFKVTTNTQLTTLQQAEAVFATYTCDMPKPADIKDDYLVACDTGATADQPGTVKYLLAPAKLEGTDLSGASAGIPSNSLGGDWIVNLTFKGRAVNEWGDETTSSNKLPECPGGSPATGGCNAIAVVLDGIVQSAPRIDEPILGGQAQITGNFGQKEATNLANVLKYGALPLQFTQAQVVSVSATLGNDQLTAGLLAGAIGLGLVVLYSLVYYRGLGLVTIVSLALAGGLTYAAVCLLSAAISFTLTLAGIAGLIVAIGITADSFVVYFERLRDEVREGRSLRSAAERGWTRAVRTILAADFVSFLAAAVLYLLSIGSVKGFAFTLGLSTLIDLFVVFFFTKPIITLLVQSRAFGSGRPWTGLSVDRLGGKDRPGGGPPPPPERPHRRVRTGEA